MEETDKKLLSKRNVIILLAIGIMLLIIPVGVKLVQEQQTLRSRAAVEKITFTGPNVDATNNTTTSPNVGVELRAPWPPITQAP